MNDVEIERWCQKHNWTEPRQLELGIWVAFPPGGVMETPIPLQPQMPKALVLEDILDFCLLAVVTITMVAVAIIMSPLFMEPIVKRYRKNN